MTKKIHFLEKKSFRFSKYIRPLFFFLLKTGTFLELAHAISTVINVRLDNATFLDVFEDYSR